MDQMTEDIKKIFAKYNIKFTIASYTNVIMYELYSNRLEFRDELKTKLQDDGLTDLVLHEIIEIIDAYIVIHSMTEETRGET